MSAGATSTARRTPTPTSASAGRDRQQPRAARRPPSPTAGGVVEPASMRSHHEAEQADREGDHRLRTGPHPGEAPGGDDEEGQRHQAAGEVVQRTRAGLRLEVVVVYHVHRHDGRRREEERLLEGESRVHPSTLGTMPRRRQAAGRPGAGANLTLRCGSPPAATCERARRLRRCLQGPRQGPGSRELSPNTCPDPALGAIGPPPRQTDCGWPRGAP